jgi:hypothetical protein
VIFDMGDENGENVGVRELVEEDLQVNPDPGGAVIEHVSDDAPAEG